MTPPDTPRHVQLGAAIGPIGILAGGVIGGVIGGLAGSQAGKMVVEWTNDGMNAILHPKTKG